MIVVDASVLVNALADDDADGDRARERLLADTDLHAPTLVDLEVISVLRRHVAAGDLDDRRARLALANLHALSPPVTRTCRWSSGPGSDGWAGSVAQDDRDDPGEVLEPGHLCGAEHRAAGTPDQQRLVPPA